MAESFWIGHSQVRLEYACAIPYCGTSARHRGALFGMGIQGRVGSKIYDERLIDMGLKKPRGVCFNRNGIGALAAAVKIG
jgi:hypothetical protein